MKAASAALVALMALYDPCFFSDDRAMTMFPDETMADRVTRQHPMQSGKITGAASRLPKSDGKTLQAQMRP